MKILSIRLSDEEYKKLKSQCEGDIALSTYIKSIIFSENKKKLNCLTNAIIMGKINEKIKNDDKYKKGYEFVLSDLLDDEEYSCYYNFIAAARDFFKYASTPGTDAYNTVDAIGGKPAKYKIK